MDWLTIVYQVLLAAARSQLKPEETFINLGEMFFKCSEELQRKAASDDLRQALGRFEGELREVKRMLTKGNPSVLTTPNVNLGLGERATIDLLLSSVRFRVSPKLIEFDYERLLDHIAQPLTIGDTTICTLEEKASLDLDALPVFKKEVVFQGAKLTRIARGLELRLPRALGRIGGALMHAMQALDIPMNSALPLEIYAGSGSTTPDFRLNGRALRGVRTNGPPALRIPRVRGVALELRRCSGHEGAPLRPLFILADAGKKEA
jgi:hypothetical protein